MCCSDILAIGFVARSEVFLYRSSGRVGAVAIRQVYFCEVYSSSGNRVVKH